MKKLLMTLLVFIPLTSYAATTVDYLQKNWAIANYQSEGQSQEQKFESLIAQADAAVASHPSDAELLIWQGIIKSTYAGKASGFSALGLVKDAKKSLETAMKLNDQALQGSAYTSLGALYYQVPGWPISFGSDKKARQMLEKAVSINPDGIDSNYFYGEFLMQEKQYEAARNALTKALAAKAREGRELADAGRRDEIHALLSQLEQY